MTWPAAFALITITLILVVGAIVCAALWVGRKG